MATNTPNYNLIKPDGNDPVNISDINGNSDIIDTTLKNLNDRILPIATQAQAQAGTSNTTLTTPLRVKEWTSHFGIGSETLRDSPTNDFNNLVTGGFWRLTTPTNAPFSGGYFNVIVIPRNTLVTTQIAISDIADRMFMRNKTNGVWGSWVEVFTSKNISTQAQAQAGTDNTTLMTPLRTKQAIDNSPITRYGTATGTNALTITANPLFDNLYTGLTVKFKNTNANTGNVTINVNSKGVKSVLNNDGTQIQSGKLKADALYEITYDGTNFLLTKGGGDSLDWTDTDESINNAFYNKTSDLSDRTLINKNEYLQVSVTNSSSTANRIIKSNVDGTVINTINFNNIAYNKVFIIDENTFQCSNVTPGGNIDSYDLLTGTLKSSVSTPNSLEYGPIFFVDLSNSVNYIVSSLNSSGSVLNLYDTSGNFIFATPFYSISNVKKMAKDTWLIVGSNNTGQTIYSVLNWDVNRTITNGFNIFNFSNINNLISYAFLKSKGDY